MIEDKAKMTLFVLVCSSHILLIMLLSLSFLCNFVINMNIEILDLMQH